MFTAEGRKGVGAIVGLFWATTLVAVMMVCLYHPDDRIHTCDVPSCVGDLACEKGRCVNNVMPVRMGVT